MRLNWIIGTEGSGHFMLRSLLRKHLARPTTVDKGDYYPLFVQRWQPGKVRLPRTLVRQELVRILDAYRRQGVTHLYEDTSFPFGPFRTVLTRPDIVDFTSLFDGICEIFVTILYREPLETTYSAFRRGFSDSLAMECLITESCHHQISSQMAHYPGLFKTLSFDEFLSDPASFIKPLAEWLDIPADEFEPEACDPARPVKVGGIPEEAKAVLNDFFDPARKSQWECFYKKNRFGAPVGVFPECNS